MTVPSSNTLISVEQLAQYLASSDPAVVIDASFDLADVDAGRRAFGAAHIAGSHHLNLDADLSGAKTGRNGRHPRPDRSQFRALIGPLGIGPETTVVALDAHGGVYAARVWWLLRWLGHPQVMVLDGGLAAWLAAGGAVVSGDSSKPGTTLASAPYPERESLERVWSADEVAAGLGRIRLIDARAADRFRGDVEPLDAKAGHIPGATNRFWKDNLDSRGRWKDAPTLKAEYLALLGSADTAAQRIDATVHQCGSGVTACHNLLAMAHAGLHGSGLYAGSWSEWSADAARPVARG